MSEFQFIVNGELVSFDNYDDIPEDFEHVIKFSPDVPSEPHTEEDHEEMETYNAKLQELMRRENASSN